MSTLCTASKCRVHRIGGNPLVRVGQVVGAAIRNRNSSIPDNRQLLHEVEGEMSEIPGCRKLAHTESFRCLDKAAARSDDGMQAGAWKLCTVTQVEEVKCLIRVMPVGLLVIVFVGATLSMVSTFFEEQAAATNGKLVGDLSIAPASMQLFNIGGALLTGLVCSTMSGSQLTKWPSSCKSQSITSLQLLGMAMVMGIVSMIVSALVEAYRLEVANGGGSLISTSWLIPQNVVLGISANLLYAGKTGFFYNEVSDGMRSTGLSLAFLFAGTSSYLASVLVVVVAAISSGGGGSGWIPDDLNEGHLDYYYWFMACLLTLAFGLFLVYAHSYCYRDEIVPCLSQ